MVRSWDGDQAYVTNVYTQLLCKSQWGEFFLLLEKMKEESEETGIPTQIIIECPAPMDTWCEGTPKAALMVAGVQDIEESRKPWVPFVFDGNPWETFELFHITWEGGVQINLIYISKNRELLADIWDYIEWMEWISKWMNEVNELQASGTMKLDWRILAFHYS